MKAGSIVATIRVQGIVQGVGFRPAVFRWATELGLDGWVRNDAGGVTIRIAGSEERIHRFREGFPGRMPSAALVDVLQTVEESPGGLAPGFSILDSEARDAGPGGFPLAPDLAMCPDCRRELTDPRDRRFRYPFLNCTACGPRYSIIESQPYDRPNTVMREFPLCEACRCEYESPIDRRFHAQPVACPVCGPHLETLAPDGRSLALGEEALQQAVAALRQGRILALKGLGGFQLLGDARRPEAVATLRARKHRPEKPLAVMVPSIDWARAWCRIDGVEARLLAGPVAPIVLCDRLPDPDPAFALPAEEVAPGSSLLGLMLPYSPLHHLLLEDCGFPVVATSGNLADEPLCIDNAEALTRLSGIADLFLVHNRRIVRPVDDSVCRVMAGREVVFRSARGWAPLRLSCPSGEPCRAVGGAGGHQKAALCRSRGGQLVLSQHLGDLDSPLAMRTYARSAADLETFLSRPATEMAVDRHPRYASTVWSVDQRLPSRPVQHHLAHALAAFVEHGLEAPALAIVWDGTGLGTDDTIWGGEILAVAPPRWARVARLRPFPLPGGDAAIREPWRCLLGLLHAWLGPRWWDAPEPLPTAVRTVLSRVPPAAAGTLRQALEKRINTPPVATIGRLFDAVSVLLGLAWNVSFDGQAAMALEQAAARGQGAGLPPAPPEPRLTLRPVAGGPTVLDWEPLLAWICGALDRGASVPLLASGFHSALVQAALAVCRTAGLSTVILTGGCFQNRLLTEDLARHLAESGSSPVIPRLVPPNDGGLAIGQAAAVRLSMEELPCAWPFPAVS